LAAHAEVETVETLLDVVVALASLERLVVDQASCHDDPLEVIRLEAQIRWWELILTILACGVRVER
jgi:hypothetical protein